MTDAERSYISKKAYQDFMNGLADISQREPVAPEHCGLESPGISKDDLAKLTRQAKWERLIQDRYATDCTYRFKQRLSKRAAAFYEAKQRNAGPSPADYRYGIPIRRDTAELLSRPPESDNDPVAVASVAFSLLSLLFVEFSHVRALWTLEHADEGMTPTGRLGLSPTAFSVLCFLLKEAAFVTRPLVLAACALALSGAALVASPVLLGYYVLLVRGHEDKARHLRRAAEKSVVPFLRSKAKLVSSLVRSLSTAWRCRKLVQQLRSRECNPSFKDFDMLLLGLANAMFSAFLIVGIGRLHAKATADELSSLPVSLILLLKSFVEQRMCLRQVARVSRAVCV